MENLELYIEDIVREYVKEKNTDARVDDVTAISLFRSSIEIENPELPKSSVIVKDLRNPDILHSVKLKNIKFNLKFALDMVLGVDSLKNTSSNTSIILMMLKFIRDIFLESDVKFEEVKAEILIAIYKLDYNAKGIDVEKLQNYLKDNYSHNYDKTSIENELVELEKMKCIACFEEKYHIIESIIV